MFNNDCTRGQKLAEAFDKRVVLMKSQIESEIEQLKSAMACADSEEKDCISFDISELEKELSRVEETLFNNILKFIE